MRVPTAVLHTIQILFDVVPYRMVNSSQQANIFGTEAAILLGLLALKIVVIRSLEMFG